MALFIYFFVTCLVEIVGDYSSSMFDLWGTSILFLIMVTVIYIASICVRGLCPPEAANPCLSDSIISEQISMFFLIGEACH